MSTLFLPTTADVLLLYPGESLQDQIGLWSQRHPERRVNVSIARSLPEIRQLLRRAGAALVDATEDPAQAADAFLQAVTRLGADAVTMYTEVMHDGLELFARVRGSLFLAGPLFDQQWEELFEWLLRTPEAAPVARSAASQRPLPGYSLGQRERQGARFTNRFRASSRWHITDLN